MIFDLDGTLVDSAADIHLAVNLLLAEADCPPLTRAQVTAMVGNGVPTLIDRVIAATGAEPSVHPAWVARFLTIYEQDATGLTRPYPGVEAALDALSAADHALGLCTNKPTGPTRALLAALGWEGRFTTVVCGDSLPTRKPDPAMLHHAIAALGGPALYVGDSEVDAATAHAAGVDFLLFTEGYRKSPVEALRAQATFADFANLPALVARLMA